MLLYPDCCPSDIILNSIKKPRHFDAFDMFRINENNKEEHEIKKTTRTTKVYYLKHRFIVRSTSRGTIVYTRDIPTIPIRQ